MRIPEATVESIRERVDIAELIKEYVPALKRAGRAWKACCPFHQERTPSFNVNVERQIFHCFGCQKGGDAFKFLMEMEHLSFPEAVTKLGERVGIRVEPQERELSPIAREALKIREALAFAREFYGKVLETAPEAAEARRYLDKRGLSPEMRKAWGIGFALGDGHSFLQSAGRKGFATEVLVKAGLAGSRDGMPPRDFFRYRILYPITSVKGETIGFGARAMGEAQPKYLNSPDTPVFSKSRVLYGLHEGLSEIRKARQVLLLEGYMDVLAVHQYGIKTATAPLGTAVTPDHAALIKRYADSVVFVFDPDNAGASAALRGAELLLEQGLSVRIATIPDGLDPDELLHRDDRPAFDAVLKKAVDLPEFQTTRARARVGGDIGAEEKSQIAKEVLATISKSQDEVLKAEWTRRLGERLGVDLGALLKQLHKVGVEEPRFRRPAVPEPPRVASPSISPVERMMLLALLASPALAGDAAKVVESDFASSVSQRIFCALRDHGARGAIAAVDALEPADAAVARSLLMEGGVGDPATVLEAQVKDLRAVRRYKELHPKYLRMASGELAKDPSIIEEHARLMKVLNDRRLLSRI
ncbi:MAG: DNA primase [Elusimicrobia bacterium]|nr:DNA primase [Elusimicrobiota bacterium]